MQNSSCADTNDRAQMNGAAHSVPTKKPRTTDLAAQPQQLQQAQPLPQHESADEKKPSPMPVEQQFGSFS